MSSRHFLSRRSLLTTGAGLIAVAALPVWAKGTGATPFTLGVASGDPEPDGFVIWTRLALDPLAPDGQGGMGAAIPVRWEVGEDEAMRRIAARGVARADAGFAHSVHVEARGLKPDRPYWYRFQALGHESQTGRARTAPAAGQAVDKLKLAFASCAHWELGYFSAYRHMAEEAPDVTLFLGDYIYEYSNTGTRAGRAVRQHDRAEEVKDLPGYRNRYALHHTDADLQALHAAAPCLATWDDHEVENDYSGQWSEHPEVGPADFLKRRAAAYRAFYEHMPLRASSLPKGPDMRVYRRARLGTLAEITLLDGRQYRTKQPCAQPGWRGGHVADPTCTERTAEDRTMLGWDQERWLANGFKSANTTWTVIAQDLLIAPLLQPDSKTGVIGHYTDGWDGYDSTRRRMLKAVSDSKTPNPVFFGGDIHSFWTTDLKADYDNPQAPTVATEFVGTSITANGPPYEQFAQILSKNPHVKYVESRQRGYLTAELTEGRMDVAMRAISDRRDPKATVSTLKRWTVESGKAGAVEA